MAVEPVLLHSENRLIAFLRGIGDGGRQSVAVSDNAGATWQTVPSELMAQDVTTYSLAAPLAVINPQKPSEVLVITTERGKDMHPGRMWLWRGGVNKLDWKRERVLLEFPKINDDKNRDFGYPWLIHLEGRRWLMFYYHGLSHGANAIWAAEMEL